MKPCPFCGNTESLRIRVTRGCGFVYCYRCNTSGPSYCNDTLNLETLEKEAVAAWNWRLKEVT